MSSVPAVISTPKRATLSSIVGLTVALALAYGVPKAESGRTVAPSIGSQGELVIRHISGPMYLRAYLDTVGVHTACDGIAYVPKNAVYTEAQCTAMLETALTTTAQGVMACSPGLVISTNPAIEAKRTGPRYAAVSLAYNIGVRRYCGSTARAKFNAGFYDAGCVALRLWNRAGGKVSKGLVARRDREAAVCLFGLGALK